MTSYVVVNSINFRYAIKYNIMQTKPADTKTKTEQEREQISVKINLIREENTKLNVEYLKELDGESKDEILMRLEERQNDLMKEYKEMERRQKELEEEMKKLSEKNRESEVNEARNSQEKFQVKPSTTKDEVPNKDGPF